MTPSQVWRAISTATISLSAGAWPENWRSAWWASTRDLCPAQRQHLEGSSNQGSAARAPATASKTTRISSTCASVTCERFSAEKAFPHELLKAFRIRIITGASRSIHTWSSRRVAVISAKNHKRQRRKRQSVTAKRERSQMPKVLTAILT